MSSYLGLVATVSGGALWILANVVERIQEPWDSQPYWTTYLPLAFGLSFLLGLAFPDRPWRWPLVVMLAQLPIMVIFSGVGPLLVIGVGYLLALSLPGMLAAYAGAMLRHSLVRGKVQ